MRALALAAGVLAASAVFCALPSDPIEEYVEVCEVQPVIECGAGLMKYTVPGRDTLRPERSAGGGGGAAVQCDTVRWMERCQKVLVIEFE